MSRSYFRTTAPNCWHSLIKGYQSGLFIIFFFTVFLFAFSSSVLATVKQTPELKRIHAKEIIIEHNVQKCTQKIDEKAQQGFESIDSCGECNEEVKQNNRAQLERIANRARLKCMLSGLDAKIAFVDEERKAKIAVLKKLRDQYILQVKNYEEWNAEIKKNLDDALKQLLQTSFSIVTDALLDGTEKEVDQKIDKLISKVGKYKDARRFKDKDLRIFLHGMRQELRGKSKEEAKAIILDRLEAVKREIHDIDRLKDANDITDAINVLEADPADDKFREKFEAAYKLIITGSELVKEHSAKALGALSKGLGVIALAPDAMNAGFLVWTASIDNANIVALDGLRDASTQKLQILSRDISDIISRENELKQERRALPVQVP